MTSNELIKLLYPVDCLIATTQDLTDLDGVYDDKKGHFVPWHEVNAIRDRLKEDWRKMGEQGSSPKQVQEPAPIILKSYVVKIELFFVNHDCVVTTLCLAVDRTDARLVALRVMSNTSDSIGYSVSNEGLLDEVTKYQVKSIKEVSAETYKILSDYI